MRSGDTKRSCAGFVWKPVLVSNNMAITTLFGSMQLIWFEKQLFDSIFLDLLCLCPAFYWSCCSQVPAVHTLSKSHGSWKPTVDGIWQDFVFPEQNGGNVKKIDWRTQEGLKLYISVGWNISNLHLTTHRYSQFKRSWTNSASPPAFSNSSFKCAYISQFGQFWLLSHPVASFCYVRFAKKFSPTVSPTPSGFTLWPHSTECLNHWFSYGTLISFQRDRWPSAQKIKSFERFGSWLAICIIHFVNRTREIWGIYEEKKRKKFWRVFLSLQH